MQHKEVSSSKGWIDQPRYVQMQTKLHLLDLAQAAEVICVQQVQIPHYRVTGLFLLEFYMRCLFVFHRLFCSMISHLEHIAKKIKVIAMTLQRNLWRRHDFAVCMDKLQVSVMLENAQSIFGIFILCHVHAVHLLQKLYKKYLPALTIWISICTYSSDCSGKVH